jgi:hypothetical protein
MYKKEEEKDLASDLTSIIMNYKCICSIKNHQDILLTNRCIEDWKIYLWFFIQSTNAFEFIENFSIGSIE